MTPKSRHLRILLINNGGVDAPQVRHTLVAPGFQFTMEQADSLASGLDRLALGGVDAVLLDLNVSNVPETEQVATIRSEFESMPIIALAGLEEHQKAVRAVQHGADDYLTIDHMDHESLGRSLRYALERKRTEKTEGQLRLVRDIQLRLFPTEAPKVPGFEIGAVCYPAEIAAGDYYDFLHFPDGSLGVVVADASSHGFGPALLMAETRAYLRALSQTDSTLQQALTTVNRLLVEDTHSDQFVTLFLGHLDPRAGTISYIGAGHNAYHFTAQGELRELESTSLPLAVDEHTIFEKSPSVPLASGDVLVLFTDGVQEAMHGNGELFGLPRTLEVARANLHESAQTIAIALHKAARQFCEHRTQEDDVTVMVIKAT